MRYKYHALFCFISILSYSCGAVISGKVPVVTGIASGIITLSNRNNIYTAPIDGSGNYRFQDVNAGLYSLKSEIPGYNQGNTVKIDATIAASVTVPDLAIEKYASVGSNYSYTWIQDQSYAGLSKTDVTQNIVKPVSVNILGKAYEMTNVSYSQELFDKYGITLSNGLGAWTQEYAYRLYVVLERIPQISGSDYKYNSNLSPTLWTLTTDAIADDIEIGLGANAGLIRISTAAFTYAAPLVVEIDGVRGLYFSKRLHHALVNFVTKGGTDQAAVAKILSERFGLSIDTDAARLNYALFTTEAPSRFQNWFKHPSEIVDIINNFEELPEGMHKIPGFKWLIRRLDGTVNPVYPEAPAIAWTSGYMEFMESAFSAFDVSHISKLILHEKAHYIYQFILTQACKKTWADLGGWQYSANPANPNYDATGGWQTTKTTEFVSAYAHDKNPNEDFAESIASFVKNPDILKARSIAKYNFLRDTVMLSNSYVSIIRPDLTFTVLNLYPSYDYPGKIKRIATTVTGDADADKNLTVEIEIAPFGANLNPAQAISARINSSVSVAAPVAVYFDMWFSPVNKECTIFRGTQVLSKHIRSGYWQMPNVRIIDTVGLERYESSLLYGFKCYINNPLEDIIAPQVRPKSSSISLRSSIELGHPVQIATLKFYVTENTGLNHYYASLVPPNSYRIEKYGEGVTLGNGERAIDFIIREYAPTGRYSINLIMLKDFGLNLNYTYFKSSSGNSDGTTVNLDETAPTIDIVTLSPDTSPPELDVNRISVKAVPTNLVIPDGETLVNVEYYVRDNVSGYGSASYLRLRDPQGLEHTYYTYHRNWYTDYFDGDPRAWEKYTQQIILPRGSVPGVWGLSQMTLVDKAGQGKGYDFTETVRFDPNSTAASDLQITQDPVGKIFQNGDTVVLSVKVSGGDKVTYEWFKDGVSLLSGKKTSIILAAVVPPDPVNPSQLAVYLSAGTSTLQITGAGKVEAGNYYCVISNSSGRVISKAVDLVFSTDSTPMITTQPSSGSVTSGSAVNFTVGASGTAPLTYQWKKDGTSISGATASTYAISSTSTSNAGSYTVVVTNSAGSATSNSATLTVSAAVVSPTIATQPSASSVTAGSAASFTIVASGTAPLTYQWKKDGTSISGATSSTYSISSTSTSDKGSFTVVVTNSAGSATSNAATLTVTAAFVAPTITTQPSANSVTAGSAASFTIVASGTAPLTYQWKKDGTSISGATSSSYSISSTSSSDAGSYTMVVTNSAGSATSNAATLTVAAAVISPTITTQPNAVSVQSGGSASFSVVASGTATLSYQWRKDGAPISGATNSTYTVSAASVINAGNYSVAVSNGAGSVTSNSVALTVVSTSNTLSIVTQPTSVSILLGQNATFSVLADGAAPLKYEWKKDGVSIAGATGSILRLVNVTAAQAGSYSVLVTSSSGSVTSNSAALTVNSPLTISGNPTSRSAAIGDALASAFSVTATAASGVTLTYQWRKDGVNITGATSATLGLTSIKASDFGTYSVTVSSPTGTITSSTAALYRVSDPVVAPVIRREPKGITIKAGSSLILSVAATGSPAPTYQWQLNGTAITGATASTLVLTDILASQSGSYNVVATNSAGSATSKSATVVISDGFGRQLNLSTLGYVGTGGDILIPGFVVAGNGVKRLLIRAAGPALAQFGVSDVLADPQLALFKGSVEWLSNDNWSSDASNAASVVAAGNSVGAFALTAGSKDSALVASLDPGAYSIQVSGVGGTTGKAIVEAYDLDAADPDKSRLVNLATRALVQAGAGPLISGFVVQGAVAKAVLIRATGPALAGFGVTGTLALPRLTVFDSTSTPIAENAGWDSSGISDQIIAASQSVGAFALTRGTADSVVLAVLPPGSYTAQVIGFDGGSGVTLVEVYELP